MTGGGAVNLSLPVMVGQTGYKLKQAADVPIAPAVARAGAMVNLIGGAAYSSTGGIQAVNRRLVAELDRARLLRRAHFLWDAVADATDEARPYLGTGRLRLHGLSRSGLGRALLGDSLRQGRDRWLCTHVNYGPLGLIASRFRRRRLAIMAHAVELDDAMTPLKRQSLRRAGLVIAVSEYTRKKVERLGVDPRRVRVLYNGVDDPYPHGLPAKDAASTTPTVLFVGRMDEYYKGQRELLDAMTLLHKRLPALRLVFVGGGALADWQAETQRRGLANAVEFAGRVSEAELARHYGTATVFAMPSGNEGFGLVYAEAMARRLPCIGSDRDAAREVIAHGETGLCVPAGNSTALADAILTIVHSPDLRESMGRAGRERFLKHFTAEAYRARLLALMRDWLEREVA